MRIVKLVLVEKLYICSFIHLYGYSMFLCNTDVRRVARILHWGPQIEAPSFQRQRREYRALKARDFGAEWGEEWGFLAYLRTTEL